MNAPPVIFNRPLYRRRRARAARSFASADFLHRRAMADIVDRLETVTRDFPCALMIGVADLTELLTPACGVGDIVCADLAAARLGSARPAVALDDEALPFAPASFDLIVSLLMLHHANDPVGALAQMRAALKPDGLMLAAVFGEGTLAGLRAALYAAEVERSGGAAARIAPFASVRDLGGALQRAGFALPVADLDIAEVAYRDPMRLIADLRAMGETSALAGRRKGLRRDDLARAMAGMKDAAGADGLAREKFAIIMLTGWAPAPSQPKPLAPGSGKVSLADAVNRLREVDGGSGR